MKVKFSIAIAASLMFAGCNESKNETAHSVVAIEVAAIKEGQGLYLPDTLKNSIHLKITEVVEEPMKPAMKIQVHVLENPDGIRAVSNVNTTTEAVGWITVAQAAKLQPGQTAELQYPNTSESNRTATVAGLKKADYAALGDFELTVKLNEPAEIGTRFDAIFRSEASNPVPVVPASALLKTAEGTFVYVVNNHYYMRTKVQTGVANDKYVEITDGLYSGDQIIESPVMELWMAELQILRAGKSCTCGH